MKRLIKRYVLKAQVDRESDEVNEGDGHFLCLFSYAAQILNWMYNLMNLSASYLMQENTYSTWRQRILNK